MSIDPLLGDDDARRRRPDSNRVVPSGRTEILKWAYDDLLRIEQHWTDQIQNQQKRIAAVLAVNGFLLGFLASGGLGFYSVQVGWYRVPLDITLILLAFGLIFGVASLVPGIPVAGRTVNARATETQHAASPQLRREKLSDEPSNRQRSALRGWFSETFRVEKRSDIGDESTLRDAWLDSRMVWAKVRASLPDGPPSSFDEVLWSLCQSVAENADGNRKHQRTNAHRRAQVNREIGIIVLGLFSLIIAILGKVFS